MSGRIHLITEAAAGAAVFVTKEVNVNPNNMYKNRRSQGLTIKLSDFGFCFPGAGAA